MINRNLVYIILAVVAIGLLAWLFSNIFFYFVISIVISSILKPITNYIDRTQFFKIRTPRIVAVLISFWIFILVIGLFLNLFSPVVSDQVEVLSGINYDRLIVKMAGPLKAIEDFMISYNLTDQKEGFLAIQLQEGLVGLIQELNFGSIINVLLSLTGSFFIGLVAVTFITFFLLYEMGPMRKRLIALIPNRYFEVSISAFSKIDKLFSNYLAGLLLQMFAIFSLAAIGLSILGIKYALTIAVFAAVANLIPYLGPLLGALFGIAIGVSAGIGVNDSQTLLFLVFKIIAVFSTVQLADNLLFQPLIFSKSVKAHPLEIFVVIFAGATLGKLMLGGLVGGMFGMISAIPFYTILRVSSLELYRGFRQYRVFRN